MNGEDYLEFLEGRGPIPRPEKIADEFFCKRGYITVAGGESTAYVDERTNIGEDKHSGLPVKIFWSEARSKFLEDKVYHEEVIFIPLMNREPPVPFTRVQPKRLSRRQRRNR